MLDKKYYANGQEIYKLESNTLTYFFKDGKLKASGPYIKNKMEGEWKFFRATGQLWTIGNFLHNEKHGMWTRYDRNDKIEYQVLFAKGSIEKKII